MSILLTEFNDPYFRDIAKRIISKQRSKVYISTSFPSLYKKIKKVKILNEDQFNYSEMIATLNNNSTESLSEVFIKECYDIESVYLSITDRITFYPKTVQERKQRYYDLLLYWKRFLTNNQITAIVFPRVPHLGYGNILYLLAKKLKIKTLIIRETLLNDTSLITNDFNKGTQIPKSFKRDTSEMTLISEVGKELYSRVVDTSKLMTINLADNSETLTQNQKNFLFSLFDFKTIKAALTLAHHPLKQAKFSFMYMEENRRWFDYYLMLFKYYTKNSSLIHYYQQLSGEVTFKKKYIYLALHYQPERTSLPEGGVFENQLLMVDILSKSLPKNWYLYVKEHPNQFARSDVRKMNFRSKSFYKKIKSYANVKLVPLSTNSQHLIHHSQACVTLTGSTGWESLVVGKPVITFCASAWYSSCNSCYTVLSQEDCVRAIKSIQSTTKEMVRLDVLKYLLYNKRDFIPAPGLIEVAKVSEDPYDSLVELLSNAIVAKL